jgi:hypothetical protein
MQFRFFQFPLSGKPAPPFGNLPPLPVAAVFDRGGATFDGERGVDRQYDQDDRV